MKTAAEMAWRESRPLGELWDRQVALEMRRNPRNEICESIGRVDLTENHKDEKPISISGKQVRETLVKGEQVDPRIMRPTTSRILGEAMKGK